jgi:hypothetical protein
MSNYWDLINIEDLWEKRDTFVEDRWDVSFYCKDCKKMVDTKRLNPKSYNYSCTLCKWKNISLW